MSELETAVPTEQFRDRKCTFLELFQVPGTPIFLKICRELGEHVGSMAGHLSSQGEVANHFPIKLMAGRPFLQKADGWPARNRGRPAMPCSQGLFGLFPSFCMPYHPRLEAYKWQPNLTSFLASFNTFLSRFEFHAHFPTTRANCFRKNTQF